MEDDEALNEDVLVKMGPHMRAYGSFEGRVFLQDLDSEDASLIMTEVSMDDKGKYHCNIDNGIEDSLQEVILEVHAGLMTGKSCFIVFCYFVLLLFPYLHFFEIHLIIYSISLKKQNNLVYACYHAASRTYPPLNGIVLSIVLLYCILQNLIIYINNIQERKNKRDNTCFLPHIFI